jgi:hypothetical protein
LIKILVHSPTKHDSTSFYRSWGVLHNLNRLMGRNLQLIDFSQQRGWTWADLGEIDILFLQRPYAPEMLKLAQYVKNLGIKVWVDYDDNLFQLPNENRSFFNFTANVKQLMLKTLQEADVISVSTQALHTFFDKQLGLKNIYVVPNALNDDLFTRTPSFNEGSNVVAWRGSETHVADIVYFSPEMLQAIEATSYKWVFMGFNPFTITNMVADPEKIAVHEPQDVLIYHQQLVNLKPKFMHVPLVENPLNLCKSNIAWIEATYAGAVTIGPAWPEWNRPGLYQYQAQDDYGSWLQTPVSDDVLRESWQQSWDYIRQNLLLSHVNQLRAQIIHNLLDVKPQNIAAQLNPNQ